MKRPFVYIVRRRALGDVLWIEPVIRQMAAKVKKVIVYTKFAELFENYPLPNVEFRPSLSIFEKIIWKTERFLNTSLSFINLDMAYENKPRLHILKAYQQKASLPETEEYPRLYLSENEKSGEWVQGKPYVVLHLESFTDKNYRKVYGVDWKEVTGRLSAMGFVTILIGKEPGTMEGAQYIQTGLRGMISLISKASFFIGIDSGPSHIAASLGIPSLIFFGAVNPDLRHFRKFFKGYFLQQYCEYAGCYHEVKSILGPECRLVGNDGIPKCSLHTTAYVLEHIDLLTKEYSLL